MGQRLIGVLTFLLLEQSLYIIECAIGSGESCRHVYWIRDRVVTLLTCCLTRCVIENRSSIRLVKVSVLVVVQGQFREVLIVLSENAHHSSVQFAISLVDFEVFWDCLIQTHYSRGSYLTCSHFFAIEIKKALKRGNFNRTKAKSRVELLNRCELTLYEVWDEIVAGIFDPSFHFMLIKQARG